MESEGVPRIPRNGDRSGRRRGEVRVSENTPVADRSVWRSVDVSTPRLAGGGKSPRRSDLPLDRSGSVLGQPVRRVPMDRRDDLDSKGHVISQLMDSNSQLLSQIGSLSTVDECRASLEELQCARREVEELRQSQLTEIDRRCQEVDVLKDQLAHELGHLQDQNEDLLGQVSRLTEERDHLVAKVTSLEVQLSDTQSSSKERVTSLEQEKKVLQEQLDQHTHTQDQLTKENSSLKAEIRDLEKEFEDLTASREALGKTVEEKTTIVMSAIAELEQLRNSETTDKCLVEESRKELAEVKGQLRSQKELTSELQLLVEQRATRIVHLERLLQRKSNFNGVKNVLGGADHRHGNVQMEVELTRLRSNHAKLTGSYHALVAVRDRMSRVNSQLSVKNRDLEKANKILLEDKQFLLNKLEELSAECLHLASCEGSVKDELLQVCENRDHDIEQLSQQLESLQVSNSQLQATTSKIKELEVEVCVLEGVIDEEAWQLLQVAGRCEGEVQETRSHMRTISDQERQCCHDNDAKRTEVQACENKVLALQGQVDMLLVKRNSLRSVTSSSSLSSISLIPGHTSTRSELNCRHGNIKKELKMLRRRNDFLRVRLGEALSELRLVHRQKLFVDHQRTGGLSSVLT